MVSYLGGKNLPLVTPSLYVSPLRVFLYVVEIFNSPISLRSAIFPDFQEPPSKHYVNVLVL